MKKSNYKKTPLKTFNYIFISFLFFLIFFKFFKQSLFLDDLKVYYGAANDLLTGGSVYDKYYGVITGFYKYAPFLLLVFSALVLIPWKAMLILYPALTLFFIFLPFTSKLKSVLKNYFPSNNLIKSDKKSFFLDLSIVLSFLCYFSCLKKELLIGNINLFLIFLFVCYLQFYFNNKKFLASALLGIIVMLKPHFFPLLMIQFIFGHYLGSCISFMAIVFCFLIPLPFWGLEKTVSLTLDWFHAILQHNSALDYLNKKHTLQHFFAQFFTSSASIDPDYFVKIIILSSIFILGIISYIYRFFFKNINQDFLYFLLMTYTAALIPNIFLTDTEHFLYGIPFLSLVMYSALQCIFVKQENLKKKNQFIYCMIGICLYIYLPSILNLEIQKYKGLFYLVLLTGGFIFITKNIFICHNQSKKIQKYSQAQQVLT